MMTVALVAARKKEQKEEKFQNSLLALTKKMKERLFGEDPESLRNKALAKVKKKVDDAGGISGIFSKIASMLGSGGAKLFAGFAGLAVVGALKKAYDWMTENNPEFGKHVRNILESLGKFVSNTVSKFKDFITDPENVKVIKETIGKISKGITDTLGAVYNWIDENKEELAKHARNILTGLGDFVGKTVTKIKEFVNDPENRKVILDTATKIKDGIVDLVKTGFNLIVDFAKENPKAALAGVGLMAITDTFGAGSLVCKLAKFIGPKLLANPMVLLGTVAIGGLIKNISDAWEESDKTAGGFLKSFFVPNSPGWDAAFKFGGRYATLGATAGLPFGPFGAITGGLVGGILGMIVGLIDFDELKEDLSAMWQDIKDGWFSLFGDEKDKKEIQERKAQRNARESKYIPPNLNERSVEELQAESDKLNNKIDNIKDPAERNAAQEALRKIDQVKNNKDGLERMDPNMSMMDLSDMSKNAEGTIVPLSRRIGDDNAIGRGIPAIVGEAGPEKIFRRATGDISEVAGMQKTELYPGDAVIPMERGKNHNFRKKYGIGDDNAGMSSFVERASDMFSSGVVGLVSTALNLGNLVSNGAKSLFGESSGSGSRSYGLTRYNFDVDDLGSLSAKYESGTRGSGAIGYDPNGGTSYGSYQFSSRAGSLKAFLEWAKTNGSAGRQIHDEMLKAAGGNWANLNTGSKGGIPAETWKKLADENVITRKLEHEYILKKMYEPALEQLTPELRDMVKKSAILSQVFWSTVVQHGQGKAPKIWNEVYKPGMSPEILAAAVYERRSRDFTSSPASVQNSVKRRFIEENAVVQDLFHKEKETKKNLPNGKKTNAGYLYPKGYPNISPENLAAWKTDDPLVWPTPDSTITSPFGYRDMKGQEGSSNHAGIDIKANTGDPVLAAMSGIVKKIDSNYGSIEIEHPGGWITRYLHLSGGKVKPGDSITAGQRIGSAGGTGPKGGNQFAPHLHYEMIKNGTVVDPEAVFHSSPRAKKPVDLKYAGDIKEGRHLEAKLKDGYRIGDDSGLPMTKGTSIPKQFSDLRQNATDDIKNSSLIKSLTEVVQKINVPQPIPVPVMPQMGGSVPSGGGQAASIGEVGTDMQTDNIFNQLGTVLRNFAIAHSNVLITTT